MIWIPINAGAEYFVAEKRYLEAKSKEEKIKALEEMIKFAPKHKGGHNLLSQLKHRLKKLKKESKKGKSSSKQKSSIKKEGAAQVCVIGLTNSGKSTLLKALTNVDAEIADYPYTTKQPVVGMMNYGDVLIQLIEIPSTFDSEFTSLLQTCDEIIVLLDGDQPVDKQIEELNEIIKKNKVGNKDIIWVLNKAEGKTRLGMINISAIAKIGMNKLKDEIWYRLGLIRVYTKSPGKEKVVPPVTLPKDTTVKDVARSIHKDFLKTFNFARVFNNSQFSGQKVGLDFKLNDLDVVEIHTK
ncbi:MAG: GTPase [Candidatus Aenigmatarchaeota archaeon]